MFTKLLFLSFGTILVLDFIPFSSADHWCNDGSFCSSPSYCCYYGSGCCSDKKYDLLDFLGYFYFQILFAIVFLVVLILCCRCCCCRSQRGVVYQQGVVTQTTAQTTYQQPPIGFQQPLPPNVMYPAYQPMDSPYQQQYSANPYYPGAPPPYATIQTSVPMPQPST